MRRLIVLALTLSSISAFLQSSIPPVLHSGAAERGYAALAERFDEKAAMDVVRFMDRSWRIAGNPGFRIVFAYKTDDGLKMKGVVYGLMQGEWFYVLKFAAPQRHYFDRDLKTFEQVVASARLIKS